MSATSAINDIIAALNALEWVTTVNETDRNPGGVYSVYILADGLENTKALIGAVTREYTLAMRLIVSGSAATTTDTFDKMVEMEAAVEGVSTLSGGNQIRPILEDSWEPIESPLNGYMAFQTNITLTVRS